MSVPNGSGFGCDAKGQAKRSEGGDPTEGSVLWRVAIETLAIQVLVLEC